MSTLKVEPADLVTFADGHRETGKQIDCALDVDAPIVAAMPAVYGTVGAVFTAAIDRFEARLQSTGSALAGEYRRMAEGIDSASASYVGTDEVSRTSVARSGASMTTEA